jgi:glutaminyl-peptide cyclotransferase
MNRSKSIIAFGAIFLLLLAAAAYRIIPEKPDTTPKPFDGEAAMQDVNTQLAFGPRIPGSEAHAKTIEWISSQVKSAGWQVEIQETELMGHPIKNVIAKRGSGTPWVILGAHFDSRMVADQDADATKKRQPVPAANDGASTVAVLTELARKLPSNLNKQVWLVFFDAEDQGDIAGWDWILGSRAFANSLTSKPDAVVIIDMIGDADLNIYKERNSNTAITDAIWNTAAQAGYGTQFIPKVKYSMEDDHTPFLEKGIPAVDIIDFDYPYWHTTGDTADKLSASSLKAVGETLHLWLLSEKNNQ